MLIFDQCHPLGFLGAIVKGGLLWRDHLVILPWRLDPPHLLISPSPTRDGLPAAQYPFRHRFGMTREFHKQGLLTPPGTQIFPEITVCV